MARQTEKHATAISRFSYFAKRLEIREKGHVEVAAHDASFPRKPVSKQKLPRIHTYSAVFRCSYA
jgi:hypothetical protein